MRLAGSAELACGAEEVFALLVDPERVCACLPGVSVTRSWEDGYEGELTVRLGPYTAEYVGTASLLRVDPAQGSLQVRAFGRDRENAARADALVSVRLTPLGGRTRMEVETDLSIRGRAAKFGGGVLADVSTQTMTRFASNVEAALAAGRAEAVAPSAAQAHVAGGPVGTGEPVTHAHSPRGIRPALVLTAFAAAASAASTYAVIRLLRR